MSALMLLNVQLVRQSVYCTLISLELLVKSKWTDYYRWLGWSIKKKKNPFM